MSQVIGSTAGALPPAMSAPRRRSGRMRLSELPLWMRLAAAIGAMLAVSWTLTIVLTYAERRDATIREATDYARSTDQRAIASAIFFSAIWSTKFIGVRAAKPLCRVRRQRHGLPQIMPPLTPMICPVT